MCAGNPTELLASAMEASKLTPEQRQKFEDDFAHFCAYSGIDYPEPTPIGLMYRAWAKWAYWCGQRL
jgi:hypothetical protein